MLKKIKFSYDVIKISFCRMYIVMVKLHMLKHARAYMLYAYLHENIPPMY